MSEPGDWLFDTSANKFNNTYFRDYYGVNNGIAVDISGDLVVRGKIRNDDTDAVDISGDLVVRGQTSTTRVSLSYTNVPDLTGCIGDVINGSNYLTPPSNVTNSSQTYKQITLPEGRYIILCEFAVTSGATAGQVEFFLTGTPTQGNVIGSSSNYYGGQYESYNKWYYLNINSYSTKTWYLRGYKNGGNVNTWYSLIRAFRIG
jgi:hypothetical protein